MSDEWARKRRNCTLTRRQVVQNSGKGVCGVDCENEGCGRRTIIFSVVMERKAMKEGGRIPFFLSNELK